MAPPLSAWAMAACRGPTRAAGGQRRRLLALSLISGRLARACRIQYGAHDGCPVIGRETSTPVQPRSMPCTLFLAAKGRCSPRFYFHRGPGRAKGRSRGHASGSKREGPFLSSWAAGLWLSITPRTRGIITPAGHRVVGISSDGATRRPGGRSSSKPTTTGASGGGKDEDWALGGFASIEQSTTTRTGPAGHPFAPCGVDPRLWMQLQHACKQAAAAVCALLVTPSWIAPAPRICL